jgi:hypothetical protein
VAVGGVIELDDYEFSSTDGITRLVKEINDLDNNFFLYNLSGHAVL